MNVHVVVIHGNPTDKQKVEVATIDNVSFQFSDDLLTKIQLKKFEADLSEIEYIDCIKSLLVHYSYAENIDTIAGPLYVGFSTISVFSAVGAAFAKMVTELDIEAVQR